MNRFHFVSDHSDTCPVKRLCQVIDIARSSYYAWIGTADTRAARAAADVELAEKIRAVHTVNSLLTATNGNRRFVKPQVALHDRARLVDETINRNDTHVLGPEHLQALLRWRQRVRPSDPFRNDRS